MHYTLTKFLGDGPAKGNRLVCDKYFMASGDNGRWFIMKIEYDGRWKDPIWSYATEAEAARAWSLR